MIVFINIGYTWLLAVSRKMSFIGDKDTLPSTIKPKPKPKGTIVARALGPLPNNQDNPVQIDKKSVPSQEPVKQVKLSEPVKLSENTDLTCNIFSFNGRELVARPTHNCYSYFKSWELLLKKRFVFTNKKEIRIKLKMLAKGWTQETHDFRRQTEPIAPPFGPWSDFTLAKERFDSLAL